MATRSIRIGARRGRVGAWHGSWLVGALVAAGVAPARGAAPTAAGPPTSQALTKIADTHEAGSTILRDNPILKQKAWDSKTVARLARWVKDGAGPATPDDIALLQDELTRPVSLSVSGAVSLGNYQGGFLYYYLRALKAARALAAQTQRGRGGAWVPADQASPLTLVTGASSGSINAFLAAISSCQEPVLAPRESLFWKTWFPVGGDALESTTEVSADGLLSVAPIDTAVGVVQQAWESGAWSHDLPCAVDVGLTATRVRARTVHPFDGVDLDLPLQTEKLMFRMRGAAQQTPVLSPFAPPADDRAPLFSAVLRQLGQGPAPTFTDVTDLLRASSAFSFAFPPHAVGLQTRDTHQTESPRFTDGGVFDDRPVGLAVQMQRWRLAAQGQDETASHTRYIVQDPDAMKNGTGKVLPPPPDPNETPAQEKAREKKAAEPPATTFIDTWLPFVEDFINTSFEVELMDTIEREPSLYKGLEIPPRRVPVAGAYLLEFMSFAERDFRVFDFYTGMVDAWEELAQSSLAFQVLQAAGQGPVFEQAPEFDCLLAWRATRLANPSRTPPVPAACAAIGAVGVTPPDPMLRPNIEALQHASDVTRVWRDTDHPAAPSEQQVFLRALGTASVPYVYRDLKYRGQYANADTVDLAIRDVMQDIIERTTLNQHGMERFAVGSAGKALANYYVYRPPSWFFGAGLVSDRGAEVLGALGLPCHCFPGLRGDAALRFMSVHWGQDDRETTPHQVFEYTLMGALHLSNEFSWSDNATHSLIQFQVGAGWAVKSQLEWNHPLVIRHGPEAVIGVALFQRLYLDVVYDYFLDDCMGNNRCANISAQVSPTAPPLVENDWALWLTLGYRFALN